MSGSSDPYIRADEYSNETCPFSDELEKLAGISAFCEVGNELKNGLFGRFPTPTANIISLRRH